MKIRIGNTKDYGVNPVNQLCATGSRFSPAKHRYGTLVIFHLGVPLSKSFINKSVFRAAIVQNKEFLRQELGIEVKDLFEDIKSDIPEVDSSPETHTVVIADMSYVALKKHAEELGIEFKGNIKKEELIELIENHKEE